MPLFSFAFKDQEPGRPSMNHLGVVNVRSYKAKYNGSMIR